jgi:hypothetical protein
MITLLLTVFLLLFIFKHKIGIGLYHLILIWWESHFLQSLLLTFLLHPFHNTFHLFPEIPPTPPRCDFCSGTHAQLTCRLLKESKQSYQENPYLFLNSQENNFSSHDILSKKLGVCNESFSYEYALVIPHHETLFDAFPFDDILFKIHFEQDLVLSDETFLEDEHCEENKLELHGIAPNIC